jgi:hypothetical protein
MKIRSPETSKVSMEPSLHALNSRIVDSLIAMATLPLQSHWKSRGKKQKNNMTKNVSPRHQKCTKNAELNRNNTTIMSSAMCRRKNPPHLYGMVEKWMRYPQSGARCSVVACCHVLTPRIFRGHKLNPNTSTTAVTNSIS